MNLVAALLMVALVPAPADAELVALGDSYAAGVGAQREDCGRTPQAYPALFASSRDMKLVFKACLGATTADVGRQAEAVSPSTSLVTLTVGGNDAGFTDVMTTCVLGGDSTCADRVATSERFIRNELPVRLDALHAAIRKRTAAPVVVLGYPRLFETSGTCALSPVERKALNRAADLLVETTRDRAGAAGFTFVDVRDAFAGHGACGRDPWINDLSLPVSHSYHPNAAGHRLGYLPALTAAAR